MFLRRGLQLSALPLLASAYECEIRPKRLVKDPLKVEGRFLKGCSEVEDMQERYSDMNEGFMAHTPVHVSKMEQVDWAKLHRKHFEGENIQGGFHGGWPVTVAAYVVKGISKGTLHPSDAEALAALSSFSGVPFDCEHTHVGCAPDSSGTLRVKGIRLFIEGEPAASSWVDPLLKLTELEGLALTTGEAGFEGIDPEKFYWPKMQSLEIMMGGMTPLTDGKLLAAIGRMTTIQTMYLQPPKYSYFHFDLESYCGLTDLRSAMLPDMNIHKIPECFQKFRELRFLYLACNYLTEAPKALRELPELRALVAFRQGEFTPCHLTAIGDDLLPILQGQDLRSCKYTWESKMGLDCYPNAGDCDNARVICPWLSIGGTMQDWIDLKLPKLEKLWLDGNFISGSLPKEWTKAYPQVISLDLYNNNLTGSIPQSWAEFTWTKLQLQDNFLSGEVPSAMWQSKSCNFNLAWNRGLSGCFPKDSNDRADKYMGTGVSACKSKEEL